MRPLLFFLAAALLAQDEARVQDFTYLYAATPGAPLLLALPDAAGRDAAKTCWTRWRPPAQARGWSLAVPVLDQGLDAAALAAQAVVLDRRARAKADPERTWLAGGSAALYVAARVPDLWAAALAAGGTADPAIQSNRLFAANTQLVPVMWISEAPREKLAVAGYNLVTPSNLEEALGWLAGQRREPFPSKIDCETGNPAFSRCYWLEIVKFDPSQRNDALGSSRVSPGFGASLALGGCGFNPSLPGPGVVIGWLPENYKGPLKLEDRIVAVGGREIPDARGYLEYMDQVREEKRVAVMVQRGKEKLRIETHTVLPKREEIATARVTGEFLVEARELMLISRGAAVLRLRVPAHWAPARITWNGLEAGTADAAGC